MDELHHPGGNSGFSCHRRADEISVRHLPNRQKQTKKKGTKFQTDKAAIVSCKKKKKDTRKVNIQQKHFAMVDPM